MGNSISLSLIILAIATALTNADAINPNSGLAAFGFRATIASKKTIAPHIIYQSTDGNVREVYWSSDKAWKQGGFNTEAGFKPRANTPLAAASFPADASTDAQIVRMTAARAP